MATDASESRQVAEKMIIRGTIVAQGFSVTPRHVQRHRTTPSKQPSDRYSGVTHTEIPHRTRQLFLLPSPSLGYVLPSLENLVRMYPRNPSKRTWRALKNSAQGCFEESVLSPAFWANSPKEKRKTKCDFFSFWIRNMQFHSFGQRSSRSPRGKLLPNMFRFPISDFQLQTVKFHKFWNRLNRA